MDSFRSVSHLRWLPDPAMARRLYGDGLVTATMLWGPKVDRNVWAMGCSAEGTGLLGTSGGSTGTQLPAQFRQARAKKSEIDRLVFRALKSIAWMSSSAQHPYSI